MPTFFQNPDGSFSDQTRKEIEQELYRLTDEYFETEYPSEHRDHLGASVIGESCSRKLWYGFRWVKLEKFEPRMKRLFARGHSEEKKFLELLTWMGFFTRQIDPLTDKQYKFSAVHGHYGGSSDSLLLLPWFQKEEDRILGEFKTFNNKWFQKLKADKLKLAKPQHYTQMCGYGKAFRTRYGLYCAINKDDDEIYYEFVELDWNLAQQMENKAAEIIVSKVPLPRISDNPVYQECKYCNFNGICHYSQPVEINCRSCKMASPADDGEWFCNRFNQIIPKDFIKQGCKDHVSVTAT